jgi:DNA replication initiation complex subunit (GINS family)
MAEEIITYEILYDILRREKSRQELQKLDNNFFDDINKYIRDKKAILEDLKSKSSIFAKKEIEKTEKELVNIKKIVKEIYDKRESKILQLALSSAVTNKAQDSSNLLNEEKLIFDNLIRFLKESRESLLNDLLDDEKPKVIKSEQESIKTVRILQPIPIFIGDDLNEYGPFEEEYIVSLPVKVAELLIKKGKAEEI